MIKAHVYVGKTEKGFKALVFGGSHSLPGARKLVPAGQPRDGFATRAEAITWAKERFPTPEAVTAFARRTQGAHVPKADFEALELQHVYEPPAPKVVAIPKPSAPMAGHMATPPQVVRPLDVDSANRTADLIMKRRLFLRELAEVDRQLREVAGEGFAEAIHLGMDKPLGQA
jgi:hypothetical protein